MNIIKNAIILAAGKSNRFAPFTYEKPKGLFRVKGEVLIERQIRQLHDAGIVDIVVVVGYMKEKFFYLEQKYGVKLIVNNQFGKKGNLYSLYMARDCLSNSYICCADHYFINNPFKDNNKENISYRECIYYENKFEEFSVKCSDANVITEVGIGGKDGLAMVGQAYFNERFSLLFRTLLEREIDDFGVANMFWEEFYSKHIKELTLYNSEMKKDEFWEFENIDDLRKFDSEFLMNVDSDIITNICDVIGCNANDIVDIDVISAGLTNVSFSFCVKCKKYVYRHPGGTSSNLIDRETEVYAQILAKEIGVDKSVLHIDKNGWKISEYVEGARNCNFEESDEQLKVAMQYLDKIHRVKVQNNIKVFDNVAEGKRLMKIASATKGNLMKEFDDIICKIDQLYQYIVLDAKRLGYGLVLCHNDTYEPNYLRDREGNLYLIDWEYAGLNYAVNDLGCILCRYDWDDKQIERYMNAFSDNEMNEDQKRFYYGFIPISAFYWFCWGLYKGSVGDDDSFFFLPAYRNLIRYLDKSLEEYKKISWLLQ